MPSRYLLLLPLYMLFSFASISTPSRNAIIQPPFYSYYASMEISCSEFMPGRVQDSCKCSMTFRTASSNWPCQIHLDALDCVSKRNKFLPLSISNDSKQSVVLIKKFHALLNIFCIILILLCRRSLRAWRPSWKRWRRRGQSTSKRQRNSKEG